MKSTGQNIRYIPAVDHLRAFAALLVVLYHCAFLFIPLQYANWPRATNPLMSLIYEGHTGVALFLVLSGFIFTYGSAGRDIEYRPFILNRILRIYPLMVVLVFVGVSVYASQLGVMQVIGTLLPVQNLRGVNQTTYLGPYDAVFWTITVEFQFYLIFPFLHRQLLRRGIRGLLPWFAFLLLARWSALLVGGGLLFTSARDIAYWTILGRLDQFLIGMVAATVALRLTFASRLLRWALPLGIAGLLLALFLFNQAGGWPSKANWKILWPPCEAGLWALVMLGYLAVMHGRNGRVTRAIAGVGTVSYSVYLLHLSVVDIFLNNGLVLSIPRSPFLSALLTGLACVFPVVVLVSTLTYHAIEKPFLQLRRRYLNPGPGPSPGLPPTAMTAPGETPSAAPTRRWVLAAFAGVGILILAGLFFAFGLRRDERLSVTARAIFANVELARASSHAARPSACILLSAPDAYAAVATAVGLQLARDGEPFFVTGGKWTNAFGTQHAWRSLDAGALKKGVSVWYVLPRSLLFWTPLADHLHFPLREGAHLVLTSPTLELSAPGNTLEMGFVPTGRAQEYALAGWGSIDAGGTWSMERTAALAFHPRVVEGSQVDLSIDALPFVAPAHGLIRQRLRLLFNGTPIEPEQSFASEGTVQFTIPAETWNAEAAKPDAQVILLFELPDAVAPAALGPGSDDTRTLGLFFTRMRLRVSP